MSGVLNLSLHYGMKLHSKKKTKKELVTQSCPALCDPMDCSPPGSSVHGILQARILKWVAFLFLRGSSQSRDRTWVSCIAGRFFTTESPGLKCFINAVSSTWKTLSFWPDYFPNIFQISVKTTSTKQPFLTLTHFPSPCYVDIWHSVLVPLDRYPNCGATFNFEIQLNSDFLLKFKS